MPGVNCDMLNLPLGRHLAVTSKFYYGALAKLLEDSGLEKYYTLLLMIDNCEDKCTQQYLAKLGHIDKAQVTHMLDDLIERGYLFKEQNPEDRREYIIRMTDKAKQIVPQIRDAVKSLFHVTFEGISEEERIIFLKVLQKAFDNLSALPVEPISFKFQPSKKARK